MKRTILYLLLFLAGWQWAAGTGLRAQNTAVTGDLSNTVPAEKWVLVIHGGAGGPPKGTMPQDIEQRFSDKLKEAMEIGAGILGKGGQSLDAVEAVIRFMEDCPLFNAGKGAVLNEEGVAELDASIMDGKTGLAGAVAGVTTIKNPVSAARAVMDKSPYVMLIGAGAEQFARRIGLEIVDPSYFITDVQLEKWKKSREEKHGTVGAVALDMHGDLAAATSTGGMMNKMQGRIGDSPVIGAGTYADNATCAVSCTGHGEFFIRNVVAYDVSALMKYKKMSLQDAAGFIILEKLKSMNASGGLIAVDKEGNITMPFNTNLMFRGFMTSEGKTEVQVY